MATQVCGRFNDSVAERVEHDDRVTVSLDDIAPLTHAAEVACSWLADHYQQRAALADDIEEILDAFVDAIQVWQSYEETEPRGPRRGTGASITDWIGVRRASRLRDLNGRIDRFSADAARLAGLPAPPAADHVLLDSMRELMDPGAGDPAGHAARAVIRRLNEKNVRLRELAQRLVLV